MNPKKAKDLSSATAKALKKSPDLVKDVVDFYWVHVRKTLGEIEHPFIRLPNLGTFTLRYNILNKKIESAKKEVAQDPPKSFVKYNIYNSYVEKLKRYNRAKGIMDEYIEKKNQHKNDKQTQKNLEY